MAYQKLKQNEPLDSSVPEELHGSSVSSIQSQSRRIFCNWLLLLDAKVLVEAKIDPATLKYAPLPQVKEVRDSDEVQIMS